MMKWISVKDKLPNRNVRVLVYSNPEEQFRDDISSSFGINTAFLGKYGNEFIKSIPNCGCTGLSGEITHWMPLPKPPEV